MAGKASKVPRKDGQRSTNRPAKAEWLGYVNPQISQDEKRAFQLAEEQGWDFETLMLRMVEDGYKLSVYYDDYNDAHAASAYGLLAGNQNAGWCCVLRGSDPIVCLRRLVWWSEVLRAGEWGTNDRSGDRKTDW